MGEGGGVVGVEGGEGGIMIMSEGEEGCDVGEGCGISSTIVKEGKNSIL